MSLMLELLISLSFFPDYYYYVAVVKKQILPSAITVGVFVCGVGFQRRAAVNFDETLKTKLNVVASLSLLYLRLYYVCLFFSLPKYLSANIYFFIFLQHKHKTETHTNATYVIYYRLYQAGNVGTNCK